MTKKILLLSVFASFTLLACYSQDNLEMAGDEASGYIKANQPYRIGTQDGILYIFFGRDPHVLVRFPEEDTRASFTVPNTVVRIARGAFRGCHNLEELILPSSVYLIGDNSFDDSGIISFKTSDDTRVETISIESSQQPRRYDISGKPLTEETPGINIIVSTAKVEKRMIK